MPQPRPSARQRRRLPRVAPLAIGIMATLTLVVPLSVLVLPHAHRWWKIEGIVSDDPQRQRSGLGYVVANQDDPRVIDAVVRRLRTAEDPAVFGTWVRVIDTVGRWERSLVGDDAWLRWLGSLSDNPDPAARLAATQRFIHMPALADDPRVIQPLRALAADPDADVRYNAMLAAAALLGAADDPRPHEQIIAGRTDDAEPEIARHAWIMLGLIDPVSGRTADWQAATPDVAEAILWAALRTNPGNPAPAIDAMSRADRKPAATYALAQAADSAEARAELESLLIPLPDPAEPADFLAAWRALLGSRAMPDHVLRQVITTARGQAVYEPLFFAALARVGTLDPALLSGDDDPRAALALYESLPPGSAPLAITADMPPMVRLAAIRASSAAEPNDLRPLLMSEVSTMRDLACLVAIERFTPAQLDPLVADLLTDYSDEAKRSGAILAGWSGMRIDLLGKRIGVEDQAAVRLVMRLGMWMAGDGGVMTIPEAEALLGRSDFDSRSTVLLAMLHVGRREPAAARAALDFLLNPTGEPRIDLLPLFDTLRWWRVLDALLPTELEDGAEGGAGHPPLWFWADPALQRFQIDVLRDWYLLHRHALHDQPPGEPAAAGERYHGVTSDPQETK